MFDRHVPRDRRTLLSALLFGPLFGPMMFGLMVSRMLEQSVIESDEAVAVTVSGADNAPGLVRFLEAQSSVTKLRDLAGSKAGFEPDYWRQGAELGWTSLVVPEEAGGGSVSGSGVLDLALLAYQFGLHAAPGPLGPTNLVAGAIGRWGSEEQQAGVLAELRWVPWAAASAER